MIVVHLETSESVHAISFKYYLCFLVLGRIVISEKLYSSSLTMTMDDTPESPRQSPKRTATLTFKSSHDIVGDRKRREHTVRRRG